MGVAKLGQRCFHKPPGSYGRHPHPLTASQRGQILPITAFFLAAVLLAMWIVNDSGELTIEKMRLQNTADATAYSTAVLMARNWNYAAYMNRAMVANQTAVGQGVGFAAWNKGCIRYAFWCAPMAAIDMAYINYYLTQNDQTLTELSDAQNAFNQGAQAAEAQLSSDVALANDPSVQQVTYFNDTDSSIYDPCTYQAPTGQASVPCQQFAVPAVGQEALINFARFSQFQNVVIGSQDNFTSNRSFRWPNYLLVFKEYEYGGDELIRGTQNGYYKWEWTALDTLSNYPFGIENTVSYAAARAPVSGSPAAFNYNAYAGNTTMWGQGAWKNPKAAAKAATADSSNNVHTMSDAGLRPFLDMATYPDDHSDEGDTVLILMRKPETSLSIQANWANATKSNYQVPTQINDQADGGLTGTEADGKTPCPQPSSPNCGQITTLAKAQIYFYRPYESGIHALDWNRQNLPSWITGDSEYAAAFQNQSYRYEHGSLYSPFWDAHLVDTTDDERRMALQYAGVN